jgi:hypothetical protein
LHFVREIEERNSSDISPALCLCSLQGSKESPHLLPVRGEGKDVGIPGHKPHFKGGVFIVLNSPSRAGARPVAQAWDQTPGHVTSRRPTIVSLQQPPPHFEFLDIVRGQRREGVVREVIALPVFWMQSALQVTQVRMPDP